MKILTDLGERNVMGADPKPPKRIKADQNEWVKLRAEKLDGWPCRLDCGKPAESLHHLVSKSLGGDDVAPNLTPLCGTGTTGCHGLVEAHDQWACSLLGLRLTNAEKAYVIGKKSVEYLARRYGVRDDAAGWFKAQADEAA